MQTGRDDAGVTTRRDGLRRDDRIIVGCLEPELPPDPDDVDENEIERALRDTGTMNVDGNPGLREPSQPHPQTQHERLVGTSGPTTSH